MSTPKQALADLEKGKTWPVYYLYGEEPFKVEEFVEKIRSLVFKGKKDLSFSVDRIDGSTSTGSDVLEAIQSMGLFSGAGGDSGARMVVVRFAHQLKELDALAEVLMGTKKGESPWGDSILILIADTLDGRRKFHQWMKKQGYAIEFKIAKDAELSQWVHYLSKKVGATIEPGAAEMLAVLCDGSLHRLAQEIEKAWLYSGGVEKTTITSEHVAAVSTQKLNHEMIELVQAVLEAKRTRALLLADRLIQSSEDALGLVGFLTWAIKNPGRGFTGQIAGGVKRARHLVEALLELDFRLKSSGLDSSALVEHFVIEQTQNAKAS